MKTTWFALLLLAGCARPHLGADFGQTAPKVFAAQASRAGRPNAPLDAVDARAIMAKHRSKLRAGFEDEGGGAGGTAGGGAGGAITLQAK
jgi:hypothetical protein